jgi:hypothetical protein
MQEKCRREEAEHVERARHAHLYKARHGELRRKMKYLEDEEVVDADSLAKMREATAAQRIAVARQLDLLSSAIPLEAPLSAVQPCFMDRSLMFPHMQGSPHPSTFFLNAPTTHSTIFLTKGPAKPFNAAPRRDFLAPKRPVWSDYDFLIPLSPF